MRFRNLTPHPVRVLAASCPPDLSSLDEGRDHLLWEIAPDGEVARLAERPGPFGDYGYWETDTGQMVPAGTIMLGAVEGLPAPEADTAFIVAKMVALNLCEHRYDLVVPQDLVRLDGAAWGCKRLVRAHRSAQ